MCGLNSFLLEFRYENADCSQKSTFVKIIAILGLVLTNSVGFVISIFFRGYEFIE